MKVIAWNFLEFLMSYKTADDGYTSGMLLILINIFLGGADYV